MEGPGAWHTHGGPQAPWAWKERGLLSRHATTALRCTVAEQKWLTEPGNQRAGPVFRQRWRGGDPVLGTSTLMRSPPSWQGPETSQL